MYVPIDSIVVPTDRCRREFNRLEDLARSIRESGMINPIYVTQLPDGRYQLVAGERRYRAAMMAGLKEVPVTVHSNLTELQKRVVELEENICRERLTWQEECELYRLIDELKRSEDPKWTQKDTAKLVNLSQSQVSLHIRLAKKLRENPELRKSVKNLDMNAAAKVIERAEESARVESLRASGKLSLSNTLLHGDCRELLKSVPDESVDLLLTDPPYGLSALDSYGWSRASLTYTKIMSKTHNLSGPDEALNLLRSISGELFRVMKPGAHFYVFSALEHMGSVAEALKPLEFRPPCLIWVKNRTTTIGTGYNYISKCEGIVHGFKPPQSRLLTRSSVQLLEFDTVPTVGKNASKFPFEKPKDLLRFLINQSTTTGEMVLDPFAGSASTLIAARDAGRQSLGFEIDRDTYLRAQARLTGGTNDSEASVSE